MPGTSLRLLLPAKRDGRNTMLSSLTSSAAPRRAPAAASLPRMDERSEAVQRRAAAVTSKGSFE